MMRSIRAATTGLTIVLSTATILVGDESLAIQRGRLARSSAERNDVPGMLDGLRRFMAAKPTREEMQEICKDLVPFFGAEDSTATLLTDGRILKDLGGTPPRLITRVPPRYPEVARRAFLKGSSSVLGSLSETGVPEVLCVYSTNPVFTDGSIEAVRQWRYDPARIDGKPVPVLLHVVIKYDFD